MKKKIIIYNLIYISAYLLITLIIGASAIFSAENIAGAFFIALGTYWPIKLLLSAAASLLYAIITMKPLDVKDRKVGHGQHGDAEFMNNLEAEKIYKKVQFGAEVESGILVGVEESAWIVDSSDHNLMLLAPPGAGKTTGVYIPTITYNGRVNCNTDGKGVSMILVDIKGTLYAETAPELQRAGYRTPCLNVREISKSAWYNIMYRVNEAMEQYGKAKSPSERAIYYGQAERYAKIVASSIIDNADSVSASEGSQYFNESAKGLVIALILFVSQYAAEDERHILSVYDLVIQLSVSDGKSIIMNQVLDGIENERIKSYAGAAMNADIRTSLNIVSSALAKLVQFIDAEMEQLLAKHSNELGAEEFIEQPTAIYIICPDENPARHFLASLFIRSITNDLIELAETMPGGRLPRDFLFLIDEFGNLPAIKYVDSLFSAIRSRGGRVLCALQSYSQLLNKYSPSMSKIIRDTCQMLMFGFVAPSADETASTLSKMLGNETVMSGSKSISRGVLTTSTQMVGRPLLSVSQLVTLEKGAFVTMKGSEKPYKGHLKGYWEYLNITKEMLYPQPEMEYTPVALANANYLAIAASGKAVKLEKGMFD